MTPTSQLAVNGGSQHPDKRRGGGHQPTLADQVEHELLPTPRSTDGTKGGPRQRGSSGDLMLPSAVVQVPWGQYEPAIRRWESVLGRPAPSPVELGRTGLRLSPRFVEWMMGLPDGWVTGLAQASCPAHARPRRGCPDCRPGLARNAQLRILGNGVVPQQAVLALRILQARYQAAIAAAERAGAA